MATARILVADDDREIIRLVADSLTDEGFEVVTASNGSQVLEQLGRSPVDLLILDIMMPEMDGLEVCRKIRNEIDVPIILLSAKDREIDKVVGLEVGADDYMTKPFSTNELVARVKAHVRREKRHHTPTRNGAGDNEIYFGNIKLNKATFEVLRDGLPVNLSTKEFQILLYLIDNANLVLSRDQIYDAIWGSGGDFGDLNTVTVHIKNLRNKLDPDNHYIKTVWGAGYKFTGGAA